MPTDQLSDPLYWHGASVQVADSVGGVMQAVQDYLLWFVDWSLEFAITPESVPVWLAILALMVHRRLVMIRAEARVAAHEQARKATIERVTAPKDFGKGGALLRGRRWEAALPVRIGGAAEGEEPGAAPQPESFFGGHARRQQWKALIRKD